MYKGWSLHASFMQSGHILNSGRNCAMLALCPWGQGIILVQGSEGKGEHHTSPPPSEGTPRQLPGHKIQELSRYGTDTKCTSRLPCLTTLWSDLVKRTWRSQQHNVSSILKVLHPSFHGPLAHWVRNFREKEKSLNPHSINSLWIPSALFNSSDSFAHVCLEGIPIAYVKTLSVSVSVPLCV